MTEKYTIIMSVDEGSADAAFIRRKLQEYNLQHAPADQHVPLNLYLRDEQGEIAGGLLGGTYWGWLVIEIFWIREDLRGQKYGSQLLQQAEAEAVRRGCKHAHLDTMSFQAPDFYRKHGYEVWGVLEDLPAGCQRIFLKKDLV